ncbi:MAG TPA: DUF1801 domain-containing protein [Nocardioidaceae bacterium]|nr:DUF1801 domain-containing protein [Nocardioidaceae bacterium]
MQSDAASVEEYLAGLPDDRRTAISAVRDVVNAHLPEGYVETMTFGMIGWVIPLEDYPDTYNRQPLAIASLASQKNHMALYLMGLYSEGPELAWFEQQYADRGMKLDMGRSCVRFKRLDQVPLDVVGEVIAKVPPATYIERYEAARAQTATGRRKTAR